MPPDLRDVTDLHLQILSALWARKEATIAQIHDAIGPRADVTPKTIATLLGRLVRRKLVAKRTEGREGVYRALVTRRAVLLSRVGGVLASVFAADEVSRVGSRPLARRSCRRLQAPHRAAAARRARRERHVTVNLIADWLLAYTVHGVVCGVVAICCGAALSARPAARRRLWRAALFGPLATSALAVVAYGPSAGNRTVSLTMPLRGYLPARWRERRVESRVEMWIGASPVRTLDVADPLASAASLLVCGLLGAPAIIGGLVLLRRRKRAVEALDLRPLLHDETRVWAAVTRDVSLYASPGLDVPLALTRKRICLPDHGFAELDRPAQESVLLHELAHVERHDPAWADAARFLVAVTWWQPLNRLLLRNMERDAELAADVRAVERGAVPAALVAALAQFANRLELGGAVPGVPLARADSALVERARRLLDPPPRRQAARVAAITTLALLLAVGSIVVLPIPTTAGPIRRSTETRESDVRGVSSDDRNVEIIRTIPAP